MNDLTTQSEPIQQPAKPRIETRRRISPIWIIPIVAALIAAWLGYQTFSEQGPTITITFSTASGLEAGKTRVKHKDVELGVVEGVQLAPDLSQVVVTAKMHKEAESHIHAGARFWVVRPRLSAAGASGLETIVTGSYIEMDPGEGAPARAFRGLEEPPVVRADVPGREYVLRTSKAGSLGRGSPIFFRGLKVGEVLGVDYTSIETQVTVQAFIREPFDRLVYRGSRFWNASGISVGAGAQGFKVEMQSLEAVLSGGVVFDTPDTVRTGEPAPEQTEFTLYEDAHAVREAGYSIRVPYVIYFDGSVHGLEAGAAVAFRGIKIGRVTDVHAEFDYDTASVRVPVTIEIERERLVLTGTTPTDTERRKVLDRLVSQGLRAQLQSASLLTGQLLVALDFFPDAPKAEIKFDGKYPEFPSVPTDMENIVRSVSQVLNRVGALPLDSLIEDLRTTVRSFQALAQSEEVKTALRSLDQTLGAVASVAEKTDAQIDPLLAAITTAAGSADGAIQRAERTFAAVEGNVGRDSALSRDLIELIGQLKDTARTMRILADYLAQHPEALVRGKTGSYR